MKKNENVKKSKILGRLNFSLDCLKRLYILQFFNLKQNNSNPFQMTVKLNLLKCVC